MIAIQFVGFSAVRCAVPLAPQALGPGPLIKCENFGLVIKYFFQIANNGATMKPFESPLNTRSRPMARLSGMGDLRNALSSS